MSHALTRTLIVLVVTFSGSACNRTDTSGESAVDLNGSDPTSELIEVNKVCLDEAQIEQVAPQVFECQGQHKRCVTICHRPPGHPEMEHTRVMPLAAMRAHLHHGSDHHEDKDYIGPCHSGGPSDDNSSADDEGEGTDDPGGDPTSGGGDIPAWCIPYLNLDANCDGIIDGTNDPLL